MILTAQWEGRDWKRDKLYPLAHSAVYDRRDAELMHWLTSFGLRHYHPDLPAACYVPIAHVLVSVDAEWPAGHHMIDMT